MSKENSKFRMTLSLGEPVDLLEIPLYPKSKEIINK